MWELDYKESWTQKNWCFWTVVLEKTLESPLNCKEIQPVHPKGDQSWTFIGRTNAEAEAPILWPPHAKSWLIGKDSDAGRDWGQEEKGTTEDEMVGRHHWFNGHGFGWTPGVGDGQGGPACCSSWGGKESDMTEWLNWTDWTYIINFRSWTILFCIIKGNIVSLMVTNMFFKNKFEIFWKSQKLSKINSGELREQDSIFFAKRGDIVWLGSSGTVLD